MFGCVFVTVIRSISATASVPTEKYTPRRRKVGKPMISATATEGSGACDERQRQGPAPQPGHPRHQCAGAEEGRMP